MKNNVDVVSVSVDFPNVMEVYLPLMDLFLLVNYRPHSYNQANYLILIQFLLNCCVDKNILVVWDFGLPSLRWDDSGDISEGYITPLDRSFYESLLIAGLSQIVTQQTFPSSGNMLELILVSNS